MDGDQPDRSQHSSATPSSSQNYCAPPPENAHAVFVEIFHLLASDFWHMHPKGTSVTSQYGVEIQAMTLALCRNCDRGCRLVVCAFPFNSVIKRPGPAQLLRLGGVCSEGTKEQSRGIFLDAPLELPINRDGSVASKFNAPASIVMAVHHNSRDALCLAVFGVRDLEGVRIGFIQCGFHDVLPLKANSRRCGRFFCHGRDRRIDLL
jgi:hypothetical protein